MATPEKLDLHKAHKTDYTESKTPVILEISPAQYLAVEGEGMPGGDAFQDAVGALYGVVYTIKMTSKTHGRDYTVCKLEGLWRIDGNKPLMDAQANEIHYTLMVRTPDFIKATHLQDAQRVLSSRGKTPRVQDVKLVTLKEGRCVQMLHVGAYEREGETIAVMREFADQIGLSPNGPLHDIYLSDPRRVPPERLRTIIRLPVKKATAQ